MLITPLSDGNVVKLLICRHWTVATADGVYLTQRQEPKMALISVQVKGDTIQLDAPDMESITLPSNPPVTSDKLSRVT